MSGKFDVKYFKDVFLQHIHVLAFIQQKTKPPEHDDFTTPKILAKEASMEPYFGFFVEDFLGDDAFNNTFPWKAACACNPQGRQ